MRPKSIPKVVDNPYKCGVKKKKRNNINRTSSHEMAKHAKVFWMSSIVRGVAAWVCEFERYQTSMLNHGRFYSTIYGDSMQNYVRKSEAEMMNWFSQSEARVIQQSTRHLFWKRRLFAWYFWDLKSAAGEIPACSRQKLPRNPAGPPVGR